VAHGLELDKDALRSHGEEEEEEELKGGGGRETRRTKDGQCSGPIFCSFPSSSEKVLDRREGNRSFQLQKCDV
jgi:hypothetical protein